MGRRGLKFEGPGNFLQGRQLLQRQQSKVVEERFGGGVERGPARRVAVADDVNPAPAPMRAEYDVTAADMTEIATVSGGIHLQAGDVSKGLRRAMTVLDGSYDLSVTSEEWVDPKVLAKIDVSCTRRGVKLIHSRGVYSPSPREERVMKGRFVLGKPTPLPAERAPAVHQPFRVEIDPREIGYEIEGDVAQANFTVHLVVLSASAQLADSFRFVSHEYDADVWQRGEMAPVTFAGWIEAPPGDYLLRAWIRNTATEREGAISGPISVRAAR